VWVSTPDSDVGDSSSIWVVVSWGSTTVVSIARGSVVVDEKWSAIFLSALVVLVRVWGSTPDSVVCDCSSNWVLILISGGSTTVVSVTAGNAVVVASGLTARNSVTGANVVCGKMFEPSLSAVVALFGISGAVDMTIIVLVVKLNNPAVRA